MYLTEIIVMAIFREPYQNQTVRQLPPSLLYAPTLPMLVAKKSSFPTFAAIQRLSTSLR